jgi:hypothetical protein
MWGRGQPAGGRRGWRTGAVAVGLMLVAAAGLAYWHYGKGAGEGQSRKASPADALVASSGAASMNSPALKTPMPGDTSAKGTPPTPAGRAAGLSEALSSGNRRSAAVTAPPGMSSGPKARMEPLPPKPAGRTASPVSRRPPAPAAPPPPMASVDPARTSTGIRSTPAESSDRPGAPASIKTQPVESAPQPSPQQALPVRDPYAQAEAFTQDTLQLQAVSWSDLPSERITIINGQILREGQTVDGYAVVQIRPEDVIVKRSGKLWKVSYGQHR